MDFPTEVKSHTDLVASLKEQVKNEHIDDIARDLQVSAEMLRGVIKGKYKIGHKLARALGYEMRIIKVFYDQKDFVEK